MRKKNIIAVCGKGGVGKTAFTAVLASVLAKNKSTGKLLVIDADPALGLPDTLGISVKHTMGDIRNSILAAAKESGDESKKVIADSLDYMVMNALVETEKFSFLAMGRTEAQGCFCSINSILKSSIRVLYDTFDTILIDGEAGLEQINRQVMEYLDTLILLTDSSHRGRKTVGYIADMVRKEKVIECSNIGAVLNRISGDEEVTVFQNTMQVLGIPVYGGILEDPEIEKFDLEEKPLSELPQSSCTLAAVRLIAEKFILRGEKEL